MLLTVLSCMPSWLAGQLKFKASFIPSLYTKCFHYIRSHIIFPLASIFEIFSALIIEHSSLSSAVYLAFYLQLCYYESPWPTSPSTVYTRRYHLTQALECLSAQEIYNYKPQLCFAVLYVIIKINFVWLWFILNSLSTWAQLFVMLMNK